MSERQRRHGLIVSLAAWVALAAAPARCAPDACQVPLLVEFQSVSTNRIKTGQAGFWSRTNQPGNDPPTFYRTNTIEVSEQIQMVGSEFAYASTMLTTQWMVFPTDHYTVSGEDDFGCLVVSPVSSRQGWVQHGGSYISGCGECEAWLDDDEWSPDESCPECHAVLVADASRNWDLAITFVTNETQFIERRSYEKAGGAGALAYRHQYSKEVRQTLSGEYTTEMLVAQLRQDLASLPWPDHWNSHGLARLDLSLWEKCAQATRLRYRVRFIGPKAQAGEVEWTERFIPANGGTVLDNKRLLKVTFTGKEQVIEEVLEPPATPGTIAVVTPPWQSCPGCELGQAEVDLEDGPQVFFGLGQDRFAAPAGFLYLDADIPTEELATPKALKAFAPLGVVEVVTNSSGLRQVKTTRALVDIQNTGPREFSIGYYLSTGPKEGRSGLYSPQGDPVARWTIAQVNTQPYTLRVSSPVQGDADFLHAEGAWTLKRADESFQETSLSHWDETGQLLTNITYYHLAESSPVYQEVKIYTVLSNRPDPVLFQQIIGAGSSALTNLWFYEDTLPANHVNYGKLRLILSSDGAWERYEYDPAHGRLSKVVSGFLNSAPEAPETECRVWAYDYTPLHPQDRGGLRDDTPRTVVEQLCGSELARHYLVRTDTERREIQCQTPGAPWDAPDNLVTLRRTIAFTNGFEERVLHPDGTARLIRWETNHQAQLCTRTTELGQPAGGIDFTSLLSGTREVVMHNSNGLATSLTRTDIASHLVLTSRRMHYDPLNRLVREEDLLNGTESEHQYDCCALLWSRDADGVVTSYTYDRHHQLRTLSQHGVVISNVYHGPGLLAAQWRIGLDGSAVRLRANQYDLAGRLIAQTNALGQVTRYFYSSEASGRTSVRTIHPDGAWEIQYSFRDGSPAEVAGDAVFPVRHAYGVEQDRGVPRLYEQEIRLQNGKGTEWSKTLFDMVGRPCKTVFASAPGQPEPTREFCFNRKGQLEKETDPDGVTHLFSYGISGRLQFAGVDRDGDGCLLPDGPDRLEQLRTRVTEKHGTFVEETSRWSWPSHGVDTNILRSCIDRSADGMDTWVVQGGRTNHVSIRHASPTLRIVTIALADGSAHIHTYRTGRLATVHCRGADQRLLAATNYTYDPHGRQMTITDLLGGRVTRLYYSPVDQVVSNVLSIPGLPDQITAYQHDTRGRLQTVHWPDGSSTTHQFHPNGQVRKISGSRTPTAEYAYDQQGRLTTLRTWRSPTDLSSPAITTWQYDPYRGFLLRKSYADGNGPRYSYTPAGRLLSRVTPRQKLTVHLYNRAGELVARKYSDQTPHLAFSYDRTGQLETVVQGTNTTRLSHSETGQLLEERSSGGILAGFAVALAYDGPQRLSSVTLGSPPFVQTTYTYAPDSRVAEVGSGPLAVAYQHGRDRTPATNLVFYRDHQAALSIRRTHDALERVREIVILPAAAAPIRRTYRYDAAGHRIHADRSGEFCWAYQYDAWGQVVAAGQYWPDGMPVAGRQFRYAYDQVGNRTQAGQGGNAWGRGLHFERYAVNELNQYEHRDVAGILDVSGTVHPDATVFVNDRPAHRTGDYYWAEIPVDNRAGAVFLTMSNMAILRGESADLKSIITGHRFVPHSPEDLPLRC